VKGVPWKARACRTKFIGAGLECMHSQLTPWNISVNAELVLVHPNNGKHIVVPYQREFRQCRNNCNAILMKKKDVGKNAKKFIKDGKITIEIRFWICKMNGVRAIQQVDFTGPNEPSHDIALVVEGEKVYASKQV
ncbi:hypothetical protein PMAYCL1PPCAC_25211, partial [Pristionchus mayeri]